MRTPTLIRMLLVVAMGELLLFGLSVLFFQVPCAHKEKNNGI